MYINTHMLKF